MPDSALAFKVATLVRDGTTHRKATGWANQEGHGDVAGRRLVGGVVILWRKGQLVEVVVFNTAPMLGRNEISAAGRKQTVR
jgi:hypothetical protein